MQCGNKVYLGGKHVPKYYYRFNTQEDVLQFSHSFEVRSDRIRSKAEIAAALYRL